MSYKSFILESQNKNNFGNFSGFSIDINNKKQYSRIHQLPV